MTLTVIIATRGRPGLLGVTLNTTLANVERDDTQILVAVDDDDQQTLAILDSLPQDPRVTVSVKPREDTRGPKYDRALTLAPASVYLPLADYTPIHRKGFDNAVLEAAGLFPDGIGCVCTPLINASFPGLQAPTAKLVDYLGYIYPPQFPFWFIDHWLDDVARMIGRYVCVDLQCDHATYATHRQTIGLRDLTFWADYFDGLSEERRKQARAIIAGLDEPEWRKIMLEANFPMVEYRSRWVNDYVRGNAAAIEASNASEPDARYLRVKALAMKEAA